jgi:hypothetical protein
MCGNESQDKREGSEESYISNVDTIETIRWAEILLEDQCMRLLRI